MKKLKYVSCLTALIWMMIGVITLGSILLSDIGWVINLTVGFVFVLFSTLLFLKEKNFLLLISDSDPEDKIIQKKAVRYELFSLLIVLIVGVISLFGVSHRVFIEKFAVFG